LPLENFLFGYVQLLIDADLYSSRVAIPLELDDVVWPRDLVPALL